MTLRRRSDRRNSSTATAKDEGRALICRRSLSASVSRAGPEGEGNGKPSGSHGRRTPNALASTPRC
jgi:hypothetical protein